MPTAISAGSGWNGWVRVLKAAGIPLAFLFAAMTADGVSGQIKYTPESPEVEAMCRKAVKYLEAHTPSGPHELVLAGITVVEVSKRYDKSVPTDHPVVVAAVNSVVNEIKAMRELLKKQPGEIPEIAKPGMYELCLSIILLCEVDQSTFENDINYLVSYLMSRQLSSGGFSYTKPGNGDVSQGQYIGLALAVLKVHNLDTNGEAAAKLLDFYCQTQLRDQFGGKHEGSWTYQYTDFEPSTDGSKVHAPLHVAGASSLYLLADYLNLATSTGVGAKKKIAGIKRELPPSVREHFVNKPGAQRVANAPLASFDRGKLNNAKTRANRWLKDHFAIQTETKDWTYYFLYGLERYCFFREKIGEGTPEFPDWYDQGVEFLKATQAGGGSWSPANEGDENTNNATCLATLFLVRSSQVLLDDAGQGALHLNGSNIWRENVRLNESRPGTVEAQAETKGMADVFAGLREGASQAELEDMAYALGPAIREFTTRGDKSRAEQMAFLRGLVSEYDPFRRLIAVKFLASQQDLDNVPALLYALTDPEIEIGIEAHKGLRLISRKLDSIPISDNPNEIEMRELKKKWTAWFLGLRPGAELLD